MISGIKEVMKKISGFLEIQFIRSEQDGREPDSPFFSYKITSINEEQNHTKTVSYEEVSDDDTLAQKTTKKRQMATVSISLRGLNLDELWEIADIALSWFATDAGKDACGEHGLVIRNISNIQNRTYYQDTNWENKLGFDILFIRAKITAVQISTMDIAESIKTWSYNINQK